MGTEAALTAAVLLLVVVVLARELAPPAAVMVGGVVLLVLVGVLPPEQAFAGFANPATVSIAGLFVVARALRDHAGLERAVTRVLGDAARGARPVLTRLLVPVIALSGVMNNTPLVASAAPIVRGWAERRGVPPAHLLMPLSFAAILGGVITLIGTGPNLVVSGMLAASGHEPFGFFTLTVAGLPMALIGGTVLVALAPKVLPDRRSPHERVAGHEREYALRLAVIDGGRCDRVTIADAGLRDLASTYLAAVIRRGEEIAPVSSETLLEGGDELVFVGRVDDVRDLLDHPGLMEAEHPQTQLLDGDGHRLVECVVSANSPLAGSTLKATSFRGRYGGAVLAIHRSGEPIHDKLGTVTLRPGDALLVRADIEFAERWQGRTDFAVVAPIDGEPEAATDRHRWVTVATFVAMVVVAATGIVPVITAILGACSVLVATRAISFRRALDSLDRDVLLIVASAIGLGVAIQVSGLASIIAAGVSRVAVGGSGMVALVVVVVGTIVLTELITNVAAAALMVPIALEAAMHAGFELTGFAVAVALAASSSFLTPIGYQTNTIVYGLGGYRFGDYWRLGLPLTTLTVLVAITVIPAVWG